MRAHHKVTEETWRDATKQDKVFAESETPFFVGRRPHLERRWNEIFGEHNSPMGAAKLPITWSVTPSPQPKPPTLGVA